MASQCAGKGLCLLVQTQVVANGITIGVSARVRQDPVLYEHLQSVTR